MFTVRCRQGQDRWCNNWYPVGAACAILCFSKHAEFIPWQGNLCSTAQPWRPGCMCSTGLGSLTLTVTWITNASMYNSLLVRITTMHPELELARDCPLSSLSHDLSHEQGQDAHNYFCSFFVITELEIAWLPFLSEVWHAGKSFALQWSWTHCPYDRYYHSNSMIYYH